MAPFTIELAGEAEIPHDAERALIHVSATSTGPNKAAVSDEVLTTAKHIENLLKDLSPADDSPAAKDAAPLAHWSKTSLSSTSCLPWDHSLSTQKAREYTARLNFDIRFKKFKELGEFGGKLSALAHTEVTGIDWILTAGTEKAYRSQLRRAAAQDAMQKARDYCDVLGCTTVRPVSLTETHGAMPFGAMPRPGMGVSYPQMQTMQVAPGYGPQGGVGGVDLRDEGVLEFRPQEVRMRMSVSVKFEADNGTISPQTLGKGWRSDDFDMSD